MPLKQFKTVILCNLLLFLLLPLKAHASLGAIFSIFEAILPCAVLWAMFVVGWYLAVASLATRYGDPIGGVPPLPEAATIVLVVTVLSLTMIGPMGIIYLLLFFPVVTAKAFFPPSPLQMNAPIAVALKRISIIGILVLAGLITTSVYIHMHRSRTDFLQMLHPA